jgi:hypothetical protein
VDFRSEMRPMAFVDPGAFFVTYLVKLPTRRLLDNLREGGLADRLLHRITYDMAISRQQSIRSPTNILVFIDLPADPT